MDTTTLLESNAASISSRKLAPYLLWILAIDILFYDEKFGLNALMLVVLTIPALLINNTDLRHKKNWWIAVLIWTFSGVGVFITGNPISIFAYFMSFFHLAAVSSNFKLSIPNSFIQTLPSFIMGMITFFIRIGNVFKSGNNSNKKNKWLINFLMVTIPLIIFIVFLKLYQEADKDFYELTKFINLNFISWGSIIMYFLLAIFLFGFYFFQHVNDLNEIEEKLDNDIPKSYSDKIQQFFGLQNEAKIAAIVLLCLNLMLLLYNILDIKFIAVDMHDPTSDATLSEIVHAGIYALITSIVLVILIVTYIFRGQLNFQQNRLIKPLVLLWLSQNLLMITTTGIKNWEYVEFWGLTYKRIGVFVYLLLATIGLVLTIYKVLRKQSFWFLLRTTTVSFAICLTALLTFNWNRAIAQYNTQNVAAERIDFQYLYELGVDTYPYILDYHLHKNTVDQDIIKAMANNIPNDMTRLVEWKEKYSWKSLVWSEYQVYRELKGYNFIKQNLEAYE